ELKAIQFALLTYRDLIDQTVLIKTDNTTCVAYINHQGGTVSPELSKIAEDLWELCLRRKLHLKAEHIPKIQNEMADKASRVLLDRHDWMLNRDIFKILDRIWVLITSISLPIDPTHRLTVIIL